MAFWGGFLARWCARMVGTFRWSQGLIGIYARGALYLVQSEWCAWWSWGVGLGLFVWERVWMCYCDGTAQFRTAPHNLPRTCRPDYLVRCAMNDRHFRELACTCGILGRRCWGIQLHLSLDVQVVSGPCQQAGRLVAVKTRLHVQHREEAAHFCRFCAAEERRGVCGHGL
jgi:hypothetical protein